MQSLRLGTRRVALCLAALAWAAGPAGAQEDTASDVGAGIQPVEGSASPGNARTHPGGSDAGSDQQAAASSLFQAFEKGRLELDLRYRYEVVDDGAFRKNAHASTLRSRFAFETAAYEGFFGGFRLENITSMGNDRLFDNRGDGRLDNGVRDRPPVADPSLAEVDQAYLGFRGSRGLELRAGRMAYALDNQRFVGTAGWRQNERSYDAATVSLGSSEVVRARYAYVRRVHLNTGADPRLDGHLIHLQTDVGPGGFSAYAYLLDWAGAQRWTLSSSTFGLRFQGEAGLQSLALLYFAEYARQQEYGSNPESFELDYVHLGLGARKGPWTLQAAWEMKGGDGAHAVQTPLGTNHGKNGFADKLVSTPPQGSHDLYLTASMDRDRWTWLLGIHEFRAVDGGGTLGRELNAQARFAPRPGLSLNAKLATYRADELSSDATKAMLWASWAFLRPGTG